MTNAHWGAWTNLRDEQKAPSEESVAYRRTRNDTGGWCVPCLYNGHYEWINKYGRRCLVCGISRPQLTQEDTIADYRKSMRYTK